MFSAAVILTYFYPVLVKGLGYTDPVIAQYMTVRDLFSGTGADLCLKGIAKLYP